LLLITFLKASHSFRNRLLVICKNAYLFATMIMTSVSSPFSCCSGIVRLNLMVNLPFKALMFLTLMRPSLVLFLVLWLKLVKDFLKVRCRLALLPFLISCLIWLDLVASLPLIKERILVIILLLHFL